MRRRLSTLPFIRTLATVAALSGLACDTEITGSADRRDPSLEPQHALTGAAATPHWRHMRTSVLDYRIHHLKEPQKSAEYDWAAARYDRVTGGPGIMNAYKALNPTIGHQTYDKLWFTPVADAGAAESWLAAKGYNVESAYLHVAGTSKTKANRITAKQFAGRDYWYYNLGNPGYRAYRAYRAKQLSTFNSQGHRSDTFFFDSNSNNAIRKYVPATTLEYATRSAYMNDLYTLLAAQRAAVPAGRVVINQAQYFTKTDEMTTAGIAGGIMTEFSNTPYGRPRWAEVDKLVANGVIVQLSTGVSPGSKGNQRGDITAGNYNSIKERVLMWEHGSYLMVVNPSRMDAVLFEPYGLNWSLPFSAAWLPAYEVDIGLALAPRSVLKTGTDGAGQTYSVLKREFSNNALVVIRGQKGTQYGDHTAVTVTLPGGSWRMLRADGSLGAAVTTARVRNSEALVFRK